MRKFYLHTPGIPGWNSVFAEMISKMADSGLIDALDQLHICVNGDLVSMNFLLDPLKEISPKIIIRLANSNAAKWEWPTINLIHQDCLSSGEQVDYIGYSHLKGLSRSNLSDQKAVDWRHYLSYWTIERWKDNLDCLDRGAETVGINWMNEPWPHYSGNFWWSTNQYIKKLEPLPDPDTIVEPYRSRFCYHETRPLLPKHEFRLECEAWIGSGPKDTARAELHASPGKQDFMFHYRNTYSPNNYRA